MIVEQTSVYFTSENPILAYEQIGRETNTNKIKYGDNETAWNDLAYSGLLMIRNHVEVLGGDETCCCFDFDFGSFAVPNNNTPIDAGTILSPAVNFFLDLCTF